MDRKYAIDLITYVVPAFSVKQATNVLYRTFKNKNAGIYLKKHMVQAQKTTTKRSAITTKHQFCWFATYQADLCFLQETKTGVF